MRHMISNNNKPSDIGEGIVEYRVNYLTTDGHIMFKRLRADSIVDMNNKIMKCPKFQRITKVD